MGPRAKKGAGSMLDDEFDEDPQWAQEVAEMADSGSRRPPPFDDDDDEIVHALGCDRGPDCDCGDEV
jgi:hypothetical protein